MEVDVNSLVAFMIAEGRKWIVSQRERYRPTASPVDDAPKTTFAAFFLPEVLSAARTMWVPTIEKPGFFASFRAMGIPDPLDFTQMSGITFGDTILLSESRRQPNQTALLFHELVHVVQYDVLGIEEFTAQYVQGWAANGFDYFRIPLERGAYELSNRFTANPTEPFSVLDVVTRQLGRV